MDIVVYRDKKTNEILNSHELTPACTEEAINNYNNNDSNASYVKIEHLDKTSLAYYFYNLKTCSIKQYYDDLRDLQSRIDDIASELDDRLDDIEKYAKSED